MHILLYIMICLLAAGPAFGLVTYEAEANTIVVSDFPEPIPARLDTLARADRANGWNKIQYDPAAQTWTIKASLQVGRNDGSETWMRIGSAMQSNETLILHGNLIIAPYLVAGENDRYAPSRVNRLTMGDPTNAAIRTALKIAGAGHTVYSGKLPGPDGILRNGYGGELHIYHGTLTSAGGKRDIARPYWSGSLTLDHAVVSGFNALAFFGTAAHRTDIRDSILEDNAGIFGSPAQRAAGCLFRRNTVVIQGLSGDTVHLLDCRFNDNIQNWQLTSGGTIECVDCTIAPGAKPDSYGFKGDRPARVIARRHVIVKVVDAAGAPVSRAKVAAVCRPAGDNLILNNYAETGKDGRTPGPDNSKAIILTEEIKTASSNPLEPTTTRYSYDIEISAAGNKKAIISNYEPLKNWETLTATLQ